MELDLAYTMDPTSGALRSDREEDPTAEAHYQRALDHLPQAASTLSGTVTSLCAVLALSGRQGVKRAIWIRQNNYGGKRL